MTETTQQEEARWKLYDKLRLAGHRVKPDQVCTCPHCEQPYRVVFADGSSKRHCSAEACRLASQGEQRVNANRVKSLRYRDIARAKPTAASEVRRARRTHVASVYYQDFNYV